MVLPGHRQACPQEARARPCFGHANQKEQTTDAKRGKISSPPSQSKRRVLILGDHPVVRRGLVALIEDERDLTVCAQPATQTEGLKAISSFAPDLVIIDLSLEAGDGLDLVKQIGLGHKNLPVLVLSMYDAPIHAERAFQAGACGYVTKQEMSDTLLVAVRRLLQGRKYVSAKSKAALDCS